MREIWQYILSDYYRYYKELYPSVWRILKIVFCSDNYGFQYSFSLRFCSAPNPLWRIARRQHEKLSVKLGVYIPGSTKIGYGFYIGHPVSIVINEGTILGNNVNISQCLTIGSNNNTPAKIGNNVYIGPSVNIVEDVVIGDNVIIGAGSVVVHDVDNNITVAGVPAKMLGENKHPEYVQNRWILE